MKSYEMNANRNRTHITSGIGGGSGSAQEFLLAPHISIRVNLEIHDGAEVGLDKNSQAAHPQLPTNLTVFSCEATIPLLNVLAPAPQLLRALFGF